MIKKQNQLTTEQLAGLCYVTILCGRGILQEFLALKGDNYDEHSDLIKNMLHKGLTKLGFTQLQLSWLLENLVHYNQQAADLLQYLQKIGLDLVLNNFMDT